jgi:hypothetical protein
MELARRIILSTTEPENPNVLWLYFDITNATAELRVNPGGGWITVGMPP